MDFSGHRGSRDQLDAAGGFEERIKQAESEKLSLILDHNNLIKEFNRRMENHIDEIRMLKELNQRLESDVTELRDLCCYLDDDREKCRQLAKEWRRFGRYTVRVMRNEVVSYQEKSSVLENRQTELIKENAELRDLCVYLDTVRKGEVDVDNNQIGKEHLLKYVICQECQRLRRASEDSGIPMSPSTKDAVHISNHDTQGDSDEYTKQLEARIRQLEQERDYFISTFTNKRNEKDKKRVSFSFPDDDCDSSSTSEIDRSEYMSQFDGILKASTPRDHTQQGILRNGFRPPPPREYLLPPAIPDSGANADTLIQALKVLEIQEKLDRRTPNPDSGEQVWSDNEVDILKEMCNVAWRKLGDANCAGPGSVSENNHESGSESLTNGHAGPSKRSVEDLC